MTSEIVAGAAIDIEHLIEEARHGILSVPLSELPSFARALLLPALEEGNRIIATEQQEAAHHRREQSRPEHIKNWLENKSPEYQKAYEAFFDTVANSETRLGQTASKLSESERQLDARLVEMERRAIHLSGGRLAFFENGRFVYEDGNAVSTEDTAACVQAKKAADESHQPVADRREYLALKEAVAGTVEMEQNVSNVHGDVQHAADQVSAKPPEDKAELENGRATAQRESDDAVAQAAARLKANEKLFAGQFTEANPTEQAMPNTEPLDSAKKPIALNLDQVIASIPPKP